MEDELFGTNVEFDVCLSELGVLLVFLFSFLNVPDVF